ncbi:MAG TPA: cation transporter [Eubacteriales bacterium]|nr:cation transporter [Clostridia bacterium]HRV73672.1 cation transporter [Eubacteriales bacterium]
MKKVYRLQNLDCAHCAAKMERAIKKIAGVNDASVNFMYQKLTMDIEDENSDEILSEVARVIKRVEPDCLIEI